MKKVLAIIAIAITLASCGSQYSACSAYGGKHPGATRGSCGR